MGETTDQIENHIEGKREDLQSNLRELESKVKSATDWRHYYRNHTGTLVAAAFGGGLLLSSMTRRNRGSAAASGNGSPAPTSAGRARGGGKHEVLETWDTIKTALVGVAATKFKGMLGDMVPGFSQHLAKSEVLKGRGAGGARSAEEIIEH